MTDATHQTDRPDDRAAIFVYFGVLVVAFQFGSPGGGLISIPISFFLKDELGLPSSDVATFFFWASFPFYLSFLFGVLRDHWSPFGLGDRGYFLVFGLITAAVFSAFTFIEFSFEAAFAGMLTATTAFLFLWSAWHGASATIAKEKSVSGQVSVLRNVLSALPTVLSLLAGGALSEYLATQNSSNAYRVLFLIGAAIATFISVVGFNPPRPVRETFTRKSAEKPLSLTSIAGLFKFWPVYPALAVWLLWNFAPGLETALQFHLTNTLGLSDVEFGAFNAIYFASYVPTYLAFGFLCRRVVLRRLLWISATIGLFQMVPLLLIRDADLAMLVAVTLGLLGGMATAAYSDLLIRSSPPGHEGAMMMMSMSLLFLALRAGDVFGTFLYDRLGGFFICIIVTTLVYALIFPVLALVPRHIVDSMDAR